MESGTFPAIGRSDLGHERDRKRLPHVLSVYLDLVRFAAALIVFCAHFWPLVYPGRGPVWPGRAAVVIFFVLSGMLIAHSSSKPGLTLRDYAIHRVARIWSVSIPSIALGVLCLFVVDDPNAGTVAPFSLDWGTVLGWVLASLFHVNDIWYLYILPPLNGPYWSLTYEVWYYVAFGVILFCSGVLRIGLLVAIGLIVGPLILVMFPVWLVGVALYRHRPSINEGVALCTFLGSALAAMAFLKVDGSTVVSSYLFSLCPGLSEWLHGSKFVGDLLFALIIALHVAAAGSLGRFSKLITVFTTPIRFFASFSFSLYLYHMPLIVLFGLQLRLSPLLVWLTVIASIWLLGAFTERQLPVARMLVERGFSILRISHLTSRQTLSS